jgi:hypothetical protein
MKEQATNEIFHFFVKSRDYNGIPVLTLAENLGIEYNQVLPILKELVEEDVVSIQSSINPHIIGIGHFEKKQQLEFLKAAEKNKREVVETIKPHSNSPDFELPTIQFVSESVPLCVYPSQSYLKAHRDISMLEKTPFGKRLALGEPQLTPVYFEIDVLERYFTDPRYIFAFHDYSGQISYFETEEQKTTLKELDQIFLQSFGLGVDKERKRVVVVYLRYLNDLTAEHQIYWNSKLCDNECQMHYEYYQNTILGEWSTAHSVFSAFIEEQRLINLMSEAISGKKLFRETFEKGQQPKEFTFFASPTLINYENFISLLDKMLSHNINRDFFTEFIELYELQKVSEGVVERKQKGTLTLLEEWLRKNYRLVKEEGYEKLLAPFKQVRSERQKPAHKISENYYDNAFFRKQMDLMNEVYFSIRGLRIMLQQHPKAKDIEIPNWIKNGNIKEF